MRLRVNGSFSQTTALRRATAPSVVSIDQKRGVGFWSRSGSLEGLSGFVAGQQALARDVVHFQPDAVGVLEDEEEVGARNRPRSARGR